MKITLVTGGSRSGKSSFATDRAIELAKNDVTFIATAEALDDEMKTRIKRHQQERPKEWGLIEEPLKLANAVNKGFEKSKIIIIDCITLWICNFLIANDGFTEDNIQEELNLFFESIKKDYTEKKELIIVTNELGLGIIPADPFTRNYRDCTGRANQIIAKKADDVFFLVSGIENKIK